MPFSFQPTAVMIPEVPCSGGRRKDKSDKLEVSVDAIYIMTGATDIFSSFLPFNAMKSRFAIVTSVNCR